MAKRKDDIKYGTAQAKVSEDDTLRVAYKAGTPLEGGKIADSERLDLFSAANNIQQTKPKPVIAESKPVDLFSAATNMDHEAANRSADH